MTRITGFFFVILFVSLNLPFFSPCDFLLSYIPLSSPSPSLLSLPFPFHFTFPSRFLSFLSPSFTSSITSFYPILLPSCIPFPCSLSSLSPFPFSPLKGQWSRRHFGTGTLEGHSRWHPLTAMPFGVLVRLVHITLHAALG